MTCPWIPIRALSGAVAVVSAAIAGTFLSAGPAQALTCAAPPGAPASIVEIDGTTGCGANTDATSGAWGYSDGGVGFADASSGAFVIGAGLSGGVGAGESRGGQLAAVGFGADALALGVLDDPAAAVVLAGPQSQAYVGDGADPMLCEGAASAAVNFATGRSCVVIGTFRYATP
ncbi:DUF6764 family protein [Rhodococcus zopfii]|uniref:DUF6764 family protein n=1 Tax=Rhodococcus zopfii TaxID=43772 RepID=UPI0009FAD3CE|nr:DUF6764 family protein [Rhodococcus zopfii]